MSLNSVILCVKHVFLNVSYVFFSVLFIICQLFRSLFAIRFNSAWSAICSSLLLRPPVFPFSSMNIKAIPCAVLKWSSLPCMVNSRLCSVNRLSDVCLLAFLTCRTLHFTPVNLRMDLLCSAVKVPPSWSKKGCAQASWDFIRNHTWANGYVSARRRAILAEA